MFIRLQLGQIPGRCATEGLPGGVGWPSGDHRAVKGSLSGSWSSEGGGPWEGVWPVYTGQLLSPGRGKFAILAKSLQMCCVQSEPSRAFFSGALLTQCLRLRGGTRFLQRRHEDSCASCWVVLGPGQLFYPIVCLVSRQLWIPPGLLVGCFLGDSYRKQKHPNSLFCTRRSFNQGFWKGLTLGSQFHEAVLVRRTFDLAGLIELNR